MPTLTAHLEHNPYVGPRPIQQGEPIYGRDAEVEALYCELQARRIVVLHSPSGAGKSSLVQAGLIPKLEAGGFAVWRPIRVNLDLTTAEGVPEGTNQYLLSALSSLEDELPRDKQRSLAELAQLDLSTYLQTRPRRKKQVGRPLVLLFDQFEEVLTVAPQAVEAKRAFFSQMGQALEHENTWALLIIREDFLAAFAPYRDRLPSHMTNTFRLDLLGVAGAREAALRPAESAGREFPAVDHLVRDLSITKVQQADGSVAAEPGIYVEPVQLQVVCRRLWASMPEDAPSIEHEHIAEYASVSESLAAYYAQAMAEVSGGDVAIERTIREWVGETLIVGGIRSQVRLAAGGAGREKDETTAALDRARIQGLLDTYLIRVEPRAGVDWYELSHDRLVEPVQQDNERWAQQNLHPVQVQAKLWVNGRRAPGLLLPEAALPDAIAWAQDNDARLTEGERDFLKRSQELRERERQARRTHRVQRLMKGFVSGAIIVGVPVLASVLWWQNLKLDAQSDELKAQNNQIDKENEALRKKNRDLAVALAVYQGQRASILAQAGGYELEAVSLAMETVGLIGYETTMPLEVFKGLTDTLARVKGGVTLLGHEDKVLAVAYSPDDARIATTSADRTVRVWDTRSGEAKQTFEGHEGPVNAVAYAPDGAWLVTASEDATARIWQANSGKEITSLPHQGPVRAVAVSPHGTRIATASGDTVWMWQMSPDTLVVPLIGHAGHVRAVAFSPDDTILATVGEDEMVRIWETNSGAPQRALEGHSHEVLAVAYSPDGTRLATAGREQTARTWDTVTGEPLVSLSHEQIVQAVAFSSDGTRLATATFDDEMAHLWDLDTGDRLTSFRHAGPVVDVAISPTGHQLATASWDQTARLWDLDTKNALMLLEGHDRRVDAVAVSPDGTYIVTASGDGTARVWHAQTAAPLAVLRGHVTDVSAVAVSPDSTRIVTASGDGTARVWDADSGDLVETLEGHMGPVFAVAISPDGKRIATASQDQTSRVWNMATGEIHRLLAHDKPVQGVVFLPDGLRILTVAQDRPARVWEADSGNEVTTFPYEGIVTVVAVSPDGSRIATTAREGSVHTWDANSGRLRLTFEEHTAPVVAMAFSRDGMHLATGSEDGTARVWDAKSGEALASLWHERPVTGVAFVDNGNRLATASGEKVARVWSLEPHIWLAWGCAVLERRTASVEMRPVCDVARSHLRLGIGQQPSRSKITGGY